MSSLAIVLISLVVGDVRKPKFELGHELRRSPWAKLVRDNAESGHGARPAFHDARSVNRGEHSARRSTRNRRRLVRPAAQIGATTN
jgi:hypothetical protein